MSARPSARTEIVIGIEIIGNEIAIGIETVTATGTERSLGRRSEMVVNTGSGNGSETRSGTERRNEVRLARVATNVADATTAEKIRQTRSAGEAAAALKMIGDAMKPKAASAAENGAAAEDGLRREKRARARAGGEARAAAVAVVAAVAAVLRA